MSISNALSNALSGLTASSRAAGIVSSNLANVLTDGYAPRDIQLSAQSDGQGGGVLTTGIVRQVDPALLSERRQADSALRHSETLSAFASKLEAEFGAPGQAGSLTARIANLEASLTSAASRPENYTRLTEVALNGSDLAEKLNDVSRSIETERTRIDTEIGDTVKTINQTLENIQSLNVQIVNAQNAGHQSASAHDQRQAIIDSLAEQIPVRVTERSNGSVAIYTPGGAVLIDGKPASLSFETANLITAHMTLENGLISGLKINGIDVQPSGDRSPISGGRLSALFEVRDNLAVDAQAKVDAVARNLVERFQSSGLDPTSTPGDPGLFSDGSLAFDPANETGLAKRIQLNALVDPNQNAEIWRLRDGLGAAGPGATGNGMLINSLKSALSSTSALQTGDLGLTPRSLFGHAAALASNFAQQRLQSDQTLSYTAARQSSLVETELQNGVDSDAELQRLLLIEQAYSANARMVQTVEEMLDTLLRI